MNRAVLGKGFIGRLGRMPFSRAEASRQSVEWAIAGVGRRPVRTPVRPC